jgi:Tol biopolymer transport system component
MYHVADMPFAPGTRLGPFEVRARLDLGGLGDVYEIRDHEYQRDAAMRVLSADFGSDPDLLKRFERDARTAALLTHENILTIHNIGTDARAAYIITEPIEGRTLRDVLTSGDLPVRTAIELGVQIAQALAAAHERGIVHRDLKPENVLIGPEGRVGVVGFGLTAVTQVESAFAGLKGVAPGTTLGSPAYMSPEQVRGVPPDARSDVFTLGAILYEMLTGVRAFAGDTPIATMTAVVKADPKVPADVQLPPALERTIGLCLQKAPDRRPAAADVARVLDDPWRLGVAGAPAEPARALRRLARLAMVLAVVALVTMLVPPALGMLQTAWLSTAGAPFGTPDQPIAAMMMPDRPVAEFALSPDGTRLAFTAVDSGGTPRLWVRSLTEAGEHGLAGTESAAFPFWSPDSRGIAYFADGALLRIPADGSTAPMVIADAVASSPGAWSADDVIVFPRDGEGGPLFRVDVDGGTASPVTSLRAGETAHVFPVFLADGRFLFTAIGDEVSSVHVGSLESSGRRPVLSNASRVALAADHVFFIRDHALTVQPFDVERLETRSDAVQVSSTPDGETLRAFSLSPAGILAYQIGPPADPTRSRLVWFDRAGMELGVVGEPADYGDVNLSRDGTRVAVSIRAAGAAAADIAVVDVAGGTSTPVSSDPSDDTAPIWSPDGRRVLYASARAGSQDIFQRSADGSGNDALIVGGPGDQIAYDWSSDGQYLLFQTNQPQVAKGGNFDLWARILPIGRSFAYFRTMRAATQPQISPDRHWVAYTSFENGRDDVYVSPFPHPEGRRRVSPRGGSWPRWRRDGSELFYVASDGQLMAAPITRGATLEIGKATALFTPHGKADRGYAYDVSPDGQRVLVNTIGEADVARPITLVDWRQSAPGR